MLSAPESVDVPDLVPQHIDELLERCLTERKQAEFAAELELDTSYWIPGRSRLRMNVFR